MTKSRVTDGEIETASTGEDYTALNEFLQGRWPDVFDATVVILDWLAMHLAQVSDSSYVEVVSQLGELRAHYRATLTQRGVLPKPPPAD